jgi:hypothetical protein
VREEEPKIKKTLTYGVNKFAEKRREMKQKTVKKNMSRQLK